MDRIQPNASVVEPIGIDKTLAPNLVEAATRRLAVLHEVIWGLSNMFTVDDFAQPSIVFPQELPTRPMDLEEWSVSVSENTNYGGRRRTVRLEWHEFLKAPIAKTKTHYALDPRLFERARGVIANILSSLALGDGKPVKPPLVPIGQTRELVPTEQQLTEIQILLLKLVNAHNDYIALRYGSKR